MNTQLQTDAAKQTDDYLNNMPRYVFRHEQKEYKIFLEQCQWAKLISPEDYLKLQRKVMEWGKPIGD